LTNVKRYLYSYKYLYGLLIRTKRSRNTCLKNILVFYLDIFSLIFFHQNLMQDKLAVVAF